MSPASPTRFLGAHLVGSFPFETSDEAFQVIHERLFDWVKRVPDETGDRAGFIIVMIGPHVFENEQFELVPPGDRFPPITRARLRPGVDERDVRLGPLAYGPLAVESYAHFAAAREAAILPRDSRFLLPLPGPIVATWAVVDEESQRAVLPALEAAMRTSIDVACAGIPHTDLSIQWDLVTERAIVEDNATTNAWDRDEVLEAVARWSGWIPADVELGFHFCHGDTRRENVRPGVRADVVLKRGLPVAPDTSSFVEATNELVNAAGRPVGFVHLGLPAGWRSEQHYRPLSGLRLGGDTEIYLGLIHHEDGMAAARERLEAAGEAIDAFGIGAECGMGRYGSIEQFDAAISILRQACEELDAHAHAGPGS